ncbi:hypothetical protein ACH5RR_028627 [Cinchona calisaya]|uniref:R13L1/DRL21-like LRR repeat region domain-containing protein n=1 Tax=Cinchona calisaya TaxID=153742 RepID=A0ABD2YPC0_9GENT
MQTSSSHELGVLSNDHSWMLFEKLAFADGGARKTPELEDIGRTILKRCGGVPLAIKAIGDGGARKTPEFGDIGREILKKCGGVPLAIKVIGGQLSNLQRWPLFVVIQDKGYQIEELERLRNLKGEIQICGLENRGEDGEDNIDVMEDLKPHPNLKCLTTKGLKSSKFPSWMVGLKNLILEMSGLDNVKRIGSEFYGREILDSARSSSSCNSEGAPITLFLALRRLKLAYMDNLVEWSHDDAMISSDSSIKVLPNLQELSLQGLHRLEILTDMYSLTCLRRLEIERCDRLTCLWKLNSLSSLESLSITNCPYLDATLNLMDNPQSTRDLDLLGSAKLISSLSRLDKFTSLVSLRNQSRPKFWPKNLQYPPTSRSCSLVASILRTMILIIFRGHSPAPTLLLLARMVTIIVRLVLSISPAARTLYRAA